MAEKLSTIIIKVDLNCCKCYNKIRKVLCKLHCKIRSKTFDKKANVVIVTGVFDPECFSKCLMCKAGKVIIGIDIVRPPPPPKPEPERPPTPKPEPPPPEPAPEPAPPQPEPVVVPVTEQPPPEPEPVCVEPEPKFREPCYPVPGYPPPWWYGMPPPCHCGCGGAGRCAPPCHCGCGCGGASHRAPQSPCHCGCGGVSHRAPQSPCHCGCGGARRCVLVCEYDENPTNSCITM